MKHVRCRKDVDSAESKSKTVVSEYSSRIILMKNCINHCQTDSVWSFRARTGLMKAISGFDRVRAFART